MDGLAILHLRTLQSLRDPPEGGGEGQSGGWVVVIDIASQSRQAGCS